MGPFFIAIILNLPGTFVNSSGDMIASLEIYNVYGEKVYSQNTNAKSLVVNSGLPNGVYFVKAISEKKITVKKIVIAR